jgi:ADP-ribose pyrophosphatase
MADIQTLFNGRYLRLCSISGWEYAERTNPGGAVIIVAVTKAQELVLVEQFRPPIGKLTIEMPAGLIGDLGGLETESVIESARRELLEETGFHAEQIDYLTGGPSSAGMSNEVVHFVRARNLTRLHEGGGDETENIKVHLVPLDQAAEFFESKRQADYAIDPKLYAGLFFVKMNADGSEYKK